jgi:hypothetical protein
MVFVRSLDSSVSYFSRSKISRYSSLMIELPQTYYNSVGGFYLTRSLCRPGSKNWDSSRGRQTCCSGMGASNARGAYTEQGRIESYFDPLA